MIYLIGSLRNLYLPSVARSLRAAGHEVFDDWYAAGPDADDKWREYEQRRGRSYIEALKGKAANHVFEFDHLHLSVADVTVLVLPAGKSAHLELGWTLGRQVPGYILLDRPDRWDVMYKFADGIAESIDGLVAMLDKHTPKFRPTIVRSV